MSNKIDNKQLLNIFFEKPREYHLREIARLTNMAPTTASKYLDVFVKDGLLKKIRLRQNVLYSIDDRSVYYKLEKKHYFVMKIHKSGFITYLEKTLFNPVVILFGSVEKGSNHPRSDIDVFILSDDTVPIDLKSFEKRIGLPIQYFRYTTKTFHELQKNNPGLANNIMNGTILTGFVNVFRWPSTTTSGKEK